MTPEYIAKLNRFAADIKDALDRFGAPPDMNSRCGFLVGFAWSQLRRQMPGDQCRALLDEMLTGAELQIAKVGKS